MTPRVEHVQFEQMYRANRDKLYAYLLRRTRDATDAADLLADVFVVAWRRRAVLPAPAEQRPWLFGVARKTLLAHFRRQQRDERVTAQLGDQLTRSAAYPPESNSHRVLRALESVSARDRELLTLAVWDELTCDEIAVILGLKPVAVRVALHRARERLRNVLTDSDVRRRLTSC